MKRRSTLAVVLLAALLAGPVGTAAARVPRGFVGVVANVPLVLQPARTLAHQFDLMARSGVESVRADFSWAGAQPFSSFDQVPSGQRGRYQNVGGVPTDFSAIDQLVRLAAARRLVLLPTINFAPSWAAEFPGRSPSPPRDAAADRAYARFCAALVHRYGPHGSSWSTSGIRAPIRAWQLWSEPNSWPAHYARLLRVTRVAMKTIDPGLKIVAGGLTNVTYSNSWDALRMIYAAGGRGQFDAVAINPYTSDIRHVIKIADLIRAVMGRNGDARLPLIISEMSWPSAVGRSSEQPDWSVTAAGEAARVTEAYRALAEQRKRLRLESAYWYTWLTRDNDRVDAFGYSGLLRLDGHGGIFAKPALAAFQRVALSLEGCRSKAPVATSCDR